MTLQDIGGKQRHLHHHQGQEGGGWTPSMQCQSIVCSTLGIGSDGKVEDGVHNLPQPQRKCLTALPAGGSSAGSTTHTHTHTHTYELVACTQIYKKQSHHCLTELRWINLLLLLSLYTFRMRQSACFTLLGSSS